MTETEWLASTDPAAMLEYLQYTRGDYTVGESLELRHPSLISDRKLRLFACACCRQVWHLLTDERSRKAVEIAEQYADGKTTEKQRWSAWHDAVEVGLDRDSMAFAAARCAEDPEHLWMSPGIVSKAVSRYLPLAQQTALLRDIIGNPFRPVTLNPVWLTPTVVALAQAAHAERSERKCERCGGKGRIRRDDEDREGTPRFNTVDCPTCHGTGTIEDGALDNDRFAVLADALEDAGCDNSVSATEAKRGIEVMNALMSACRGYEAYRLYSRRLNEFNRMLKEVEKSHPIVAHLRSHGPHIRGCWVVDLILGKE